MLKLSDVSVLIVETRAHELARITAEKFLEKVEPREVVVYTDQPEKLAIPGAITRAAPDWKEKNQSMQFVSYEAWKGTEAPFIFNLEWDGGLCDVSMWRDEFLTDYIGAPWWYCLPNGKPAESGNVGNGGFSIRSRRLAEFISKHRHIWPTYTDNLLCRDHRREVESAGRFNWASIALANDFAFEGFGRLGLPDNLKHFGFHSIYPAWPLILDRDDILQRARLMVDNAYVTNYGRTKIILDAVPWLRKELGLEVAA